MVGRVIRIEFFIGLLNSPLSASPMVSYGTIIRLRCEIEYREERTQAPTALVVGEIQEKYTFAIRVGIDFLLDMPVQP